MVVHPLISLLSFIVFAAFISLGQTVSSLVGLTLLMFVWLLTRQLPAPKAWLMVKRLRIFFLSLFIMYFWFTPGQLIWPMLDTWSPTYEGLTQGLQRISALIILVLGVESLLRLIDRAGLLTALYYLATPFQYVGVRRERFIIRVLLTLEAAEMQVPQTALRNNKNSDAELKLKQKFRLKNINQYITIISQRLADKFSLAANHSEDIDEVVFEIASLPNWIQWLIPLMIAALFIVLNNLF